MMGKISKMMYSIYAAISTFLVITTTLFLYLYANDQKSWLSELINAKVFHIPLLLHFTVISIAVGLIVFLMISLNQKSQFGQIETKLTLLAHGNFESPLLAEKTPAAPNNRYLPDIDHSILQLQEKLRVLSRDIQQLSSRPQLVDGQTKEEILVNERHRLARELHDSVSQQLFAAMMLLSALNEQAQQNPEQAAFNKQLELVAGIINTAQSEMRALLLHLRPINLEGKSLRQGIQQLLKELQTKIQIKLKWEIDEITAAPSIEDNLFRIAQELLSNALRHSKAAELEVYLHKVGQNVLFRIVDDGVGFDAAKVKAGSYGLTNIKERVAGMGGTVKIISFVGQGTSIEIRIPIIEEGNQ